MDCRCHRQWCRLHASSIPKRSNLSNSWAKYGPYKREYAFARCYRTFNQRHHLVVIMKCFYFLWHWLWMKFGWDDMNRAGRGNYFFDVASCIVWRLVCVRCCATWPSRIWLVQACVGNDGGWWPSDDFEKFLIVILVCCVPDIACLHLNRVIPKLDILL